MRAKVMRFLITLLLGLAPASAWAEPQPWEMTLQPAASPIMERITAFHDLMLWVISAIVIFVFFLLVYACWRFSEARNPVPSRRSHNTVLEIVWTAVPVLVLVIIAIPSFKLLYYSDVVPETQMTIKAIGHQWYWSYAYPDNGNFTFDANMVADSDLQPGQPRLLATDNHVVVPVGVNIRLQTTAEDVIHSWAMQPLGIKIDAVPGRLNEMWFNVERAGLYYGQCSELCGVNHGFMPIVIEALPKEQFDAWVKEAQTKFALGDAPAVAVADAALPARPAN